MKWDFTAECSETLAAIGNSLLQGPTQKALDEQLQLTRLLERLAQHIILQFPVRVKHTHTARPDFQLELGERRISIEASKITSLNFEHALSLQRRGCHSVLMTGEFLRTAQSRLRREEVIQKAFIIPQMPYLPSAQEDDADWCECFQKVVTRKVKKLCEDDFQHGDEDWLILWDRLGTDVWRMKERLPHLHSLCAPIWARSVNFKRIFIEAENFSWLASLSRNQCDLITYTPGI